jgi:hypothetical protein
MRQRGCVCSFARQRRALAQAGHGRRQAGAALRHERQDHRDARRQIDSLAQRLNLATRTGRVGEWSLTPENGQLVWDDQTFELRPGWCRPMKSGTGTSTPKTWPP